MPSFSFHVIKAPIFAIYSDKNYKAGQPATIQESGFLTVGFYHGNV